jgi:hypothetical protein
VRSEKSKIRNWKHKKISSLLGVFSCFLLFTFYFLLLIFFIACGRRGDPVMITPLEKKPAKEEINYDNRSEQELNNNSIKRDSTEPEIMEVIQPDAPTGLTGLFTQKSVILTWNEVSGQGVRLYRVYRSTGGEYVNVGTTVTPAFTDSNIKKNKRYYYRVTAVGKSESPPSKEIEIFTGAEVNER